MREDICSIPIHDVFEPRDGCPICRMRDMLKGPYCHVYYRGRYDGTGRADRNQSSGVLQRSF